MRKFNIPRPIRSFKNSTRLSLAQLLAKSRRLYNHSYRHPTPRRRKVLEHGFATAGARARQVLRLDHRPADARVEEEAAEPHDEVAEAELGALGRDAQPLRVGLAERALAEGARLDAGKVAEPLLHRAGAADKVHLWPLGVMEDAHLLETESSRSLDAADASDVLAGATAGGSDGCT